MQCPLDPVEARLDEAHILWHESLEAYHEPARFRAFVNSLIQSLRNLTFVLQKNKAAIPEFETWYTTWREKMRDDNVLRWLVDARNQVVKQGDLDTKSITHVSVYDNYRVGLVLQLDVPAHLPLRTIADVVLKMNLPPALRRYGVLVVERSWRLDGLGDRELLDALGHAYGVLTHLVVDAHKQLGLSVDEGETCIKADYEDTHAHGSDWRPFCMVGTPAPRSAAVQIGSELGLEAKSTYPKLTPHDEARSVERYGEWPTRKGQGPPTIRELAESFFSQAQVMFLKDGYHLPFAFLFGEHGGLTIVELRIADPGERPVAFRELLRRIESVRAHTVMFIGESWTAPLESLQPGQIPADSEEHREILDCTVISRKGESFAWLCPIIRSETGPRLGRVEEHPPVLAIYTEPILRLWSLWDSGG